MAFRRDFDIFAVHTPCALVPTEDNRRNAPPHAHPSANEKKNQQKTMTDLELKELKDRLWHSADMLRAGAHLAANKYGQPILGLIFLR
jgi:hypothetical protein